MTYFPEPGSKVKVPEGHYAFTITEEPEIIPTRNGQRVVIKADAKNDSGTYPVKDGFATWEDRYTDLCAALDVSFDADVEVVGKVFEGDVAYQPDRNDPSKKWLRIVNIVVPESALSGEPTDEAPF